MKLQFRIISRHFFLGCTVLFSTGCATDPSIKHAGNWQMERRLGSQQSNCALSSSSQNFATAQGIEQVFIVFQDDGLIGLQSINDNFAPSALAQMGIRVDQQTPILGPKLDNTGKTLVFSLNASERLVRQLETGSYARVFVALSPGKEVLSALYPLKGFKEAYKQFNLCRAIASSGSRY